MKPFKIASDSLKIRRIQEIIQEYYDEDVDAEDTLNRIGKAMGWKK